MQWISCLCNGSFCYRLFYRYWIYYKKEECSVSYPFILENDGAFGNSNVYDKYISASVLQQSNSGGEENKNRFVELAEYLKKDDVKIYYLSDKLDNGALFYGYIWQDYKWVCSMDELKDIEERCVVVTSEEFLEDQKIENLSKEIEWWVK